MILAVRNWVLKNWLCALFGVSAAFFALVSARTYGLWNQLPGLAISFLGCWIAARFFRMPDRLRGISVRLAVFSVLFTLLAFFCMFRYSV